MARLLSICGAKGGISRYHADGKQRLILFGCAVAYDGFDIVEGRRVALL